MLQLSLREVFHKEDLVFIFFAIILFFTAFIGGLFRATFSLLLLVSCWDLCCAAPSSLRQIITHHVEVLVELDGRLGEVRYSRRMSRHKLLL